MNKINTTNEINNNNKTRNRKNFGYVLMITALFNLNNPAEAKINNRIDNHTQLTEVLDTSNIINNIEKRTGVKIPNEYTNKLSDFVATNEVMTNYIGVKFTEDFIVNEMQNDRGINKENQLLFIRSAVYKQITNKDFYDGSDGNDERLGDFMKVVSNVKKCGKNYVNGFNTYMQQRSAEARQQSAEARQQSAEARQQSAEARQQSAEARQQSAEAIKEIMKQDSIRVKERMVEFYDIYIQNPNTIKQDDLNFMKISTKEFIADCKKRGIDYITILLKELGGDKRKLEDLLKFFEIE